jgi:hypothetical protein
VWGSGAAYGLNTPWGIAEEEEPHACWDILCQCRSLLRNQQYSSAGLTLAYSMPWIVSFPYFGDRWRVFMVCGAFCDQLNPILQLLQCHSLNERTWRSNTTWIEVVSRTTFSWCIHLAWAGKQIIIFGVAAWRPTSKAASSKKPSVLDQKYPACSVSCRL